MPNISTFSANSAEPQFTEKCAEIGSIISEIDKSITYAAAAIKTGLVDGKYPASKYTLLQSTTYLYDKTGVEEQKKLWTLSVHQIIFDTKFITGF